MIKIIFVIIGLLTKVSLLTATLNQMQLITEIPKTKCLYFMNYINVYKQKYWFHKNQGVCKSTKEK